MSKCCINEEQEGYQQPTAERLAGLGEGCFVQIHRNGQSEWIEISRTEDDVLIGIVQPALSTPLPMAVGADTNNTGNQPPAVAEELRFRKEQITALGCDRYCFC